MVVEVIIKQEDAKQKAMFKLMDGGGDNCQRQPYILDLAEGDAQDNTGHKDQSVPDEMHRFPIQFPKDAVGIFTNSIPAKAVAAVRRVVDEDELEHLHHMFPDVACLQDHNHEVGGHEAV